MVIVVLYYEIPWLRSSDHVLTSNLLLCCHFVNQNQCKTMDEDEIFIKIVVTGDQGIGKLGFVKVGFVSICFISFQPSIVIVEVYK